MFKTSVALRKNLGGIEQVFIDFLNGDRSARLYNFCYQDAFSSIGIPAGAGMQSWDKVLDGKNDYYVFPNEARLIGNVAADIAKATPYASTLIELGIGSRSAVEQKTLPLVHALKPQKFVANDLSLQSVTAAKAQIARDVPGLAVDTCVANFLEDQSAIFDHQNANVLMTGSTISNVLAYNGHIPVNEVVAFLKNIAKIMGPKGSLIITQDTNQDEASLKAAYRSPALVKFRQDALYRLKALLGLESFDPSTFRYEPVWEPRCHLLTNTFVNTKDQTVHVGGQTVHIPKGKRVYASNCYKYPRESFLHMARIAGLKPVKTWMDAENRVALHVLRNA